MITIVLALIFLPIIVAAVIFISHHIKVTRIAFLTQIGLLFCLALVLIEPNQLTPTLGNFQVGLGIRFQIDNLAKALIFIVWFGTTSVMLFSWSEKQVDEKYYVLILVLQGALNAYFLVADFFSMFVLLELITIISSILILYKRNEVAVKAGLIYLLLNAFSMVFFILGIVIIYHLTGYFDTNLVREKLAESGYSMGIIFSLSTLLVVFFLKSAVYSLHRWLPLAHANAPTAMSALLSGVLINVGVYGLIRVVEIFPSGLMEGIFYLVGFVTAIYGGIHAMRENDIKRILAYSTMSKIGVIIFFLGNYQAYSRVIIFLIIEHFVYKLGMFLISGTLIKSYSTRKLNEISGVAKTMPLVASMLLIFILTSCGLPMTLGGMGKTLTKYYTTNDWVYYLYNFQYVIMILPFIRITRILFGKKRHVHQPILSREVAIVGVGLVALVGVPVGMIILNLSYASLFSLSNLWLLLIALVLALVGKKGLEQGWIKYSKSIDLLSLQEIVVNIIVVWASLNVVLVYQFMYGGFVG